MARPRKNSAEYFPHDKDMRNNPKVRAVRQRHGSDGYAVWVMLVETLTGCDNFTLQVDEITMEVLAGDFGVEQNVLEDILHSFRRLKLICWDENSISCPGLHERMEPLLSDRRRKREWAGRNLGKENEGDSESDGKNPTAKKFSTSKTPQSKVKKSKVKKRKEKEGIEIPDQLQTEEFCGAFQNLLKMPKWRGKPESAISLALKNLARYPPDFSTELVERAIIGNYQGVVFAGTDQEYKNWQLQRNGAPNGQYKNGRATLNRLGDDPDVYVEPQAL